MKTIPISAALRAGALTLLPPAIAAQTPPKASEIKEIVNIAVLARAYHGVSSDAVWNGKDAFTAPEK